MFARSRPRSTSSPASPRTSRSSGRPATCSRWRSPGCSAGRTSRRSTRSGRLLPGSARCKYGQGDAAFRRLYVDPDRSGRWRSAPGVPPARAKLVQWVDESTGKRVGPEPKFHGPLPARSTSTPSATTPTSSGSGPSSCRGRSSSTRGGEGASLSTASIRKAASRTWQMPSRQRADEVPRSRRSDEERDRQTRPAPARVQEARAVPQHLAARRRARSSGCRPRRSSSARCTQLRSRHWSRSVFPSTRPRPARGTGPSPV